MLGKEGGVNVGNVIWSPDGRFIGFACCFTYLSEETASAVGQGQKLEVATGQMETVGKIKALVATHNALCWTAEGQLRAEEELTTDEIHGAHCTKRGRSAYPLIAPASPAGTKQAILGTDSPDDASRAGPSRLTVSEVATEEVVWQREISRTMKTITWSLDGQYLLLDDFEEHSPIWRVRSDGNTELAPIVEDGFLIGVIPQWCQSSIDSGSTKQ